MNSDVMGMLVRKNYQAEESRSSGLLRHMNKNADVGDGERTI